MQRRTKVTVIVFGVFLFLGISLLLARVLVGTGGERSAVLGILQAEARGDTAGVLDRMPRCARDPTCVTVVRDRAARLRRAGKVEILNYAPSTQGAFVDVTGTGRVAWRTEVKRFPVIQCVVVKREGPLTGGKVEIVSISNPLKLQSRC